MTQVEFEQKIKEMKMQKAAELQPLQAMIDEIKERQTAKRRLLHEIHEQCAQLENERQVITKRMTAIIQEYGVRIGQFTRENYCETRTLENISEWALTKELHKRGYFGNLDHLDKDCDYLKQLNKKLNGDAGEEQKD